MKKEITIKVSNEEAQLIYKHREEERRKDMRKEFLSLQEAFQKEVDVHLQDAANCLHRAENLSIKKGLPFDSQIIMIKETERFIPNTFRNKHKNLDYNTVKEDLYSGIETEYTGWLFNWENKDWEESDSWQSSSANC